MYAPSFSNPQSISLINSLKFIMTTLYSSGIIIIVQKHIIVTAVRQWSGRPGFNSRSRHTKDSKNGT